jgi:hypothetical protein
MGLIFNYQILKTKLSPPTFIIGLILSYLILGWSNHFILVNGVPQVRLSESIGYSLFQISHVLLFTSIYLSNRIEKFNKFLLIPIIIQLIDLIPFELLQSVKFNLFSTLSIIIGWITVMIHSNENNQKRIAGLILISVICLIVSSIPGFLVLTSLDNPKGDIFQFGVKVFGLDNFTLHSEKGNFYQSFSLTIYTVSSILITITMNRKNNHQI